MNYYDKIFYIKYLSHRIVSYYSTLGAFLSKHQIEKDIRGFKIKRGCQNHTTTSYGFFNVTLHKNRTVFKAEKALPFTPAIEIKRNRFGGTRQSDQGTQERKIGIGYLPGTGDTPGDVISAQQFKSKKTDTIKLGMVTMKPKIAK